MGGRGESARTRGAQKKGKAASTDSSHVRVGEQHGRCHLLECRRVLRALRESLISDVSLSSEGERGGGRGGVGKSGSRDLPVKQRSPPRSHRRVGTRTSSSGPTGSANRISAGCRSHSGCSCPGPSPGGVRQGTRPTRPTLKPAPGAIPLPPAGRCWLPYFELSPRAPQRHESSRARPHAETKERPLLQKARRKMDRRR